MGTEVNGKEFEVFVGSPTWEEIEQEWANIPWVKTGEYPDAKDIHWDGKCPYCDGDVGVTDGVFPPSDHVGKDSWGLYRKCSYCGKVFYEELYEWDNCRY